MWEKLADFVYPKECVGCGALGVWLCGRCRLGFEIVEQICPMCGKNNLGGFVHKMCSKKYGMDGLTAVYNHNERVMSSLIYRVKFEFNRELLEEFLGLLEFEVGDEFDMAAPIPLSRYRENWRGFNQARTIADRAAGQLGLPVVEVLRRVRSGKQQSKLKTREERLENIKGVFRAVGKLSGVRVLLVDDVFTSGATMREACRALKRAGAGFVWGLTLARQV